MSRSRAGLGRLGAAVVAIAASLELSACSSPREDPEAAPLRSLIEVVAELESVADTDIYRFEPPRDVTGENLFRITVERLDHIEVLLDDDPSFRPSIRFAEARAQERLLDFEVAGRRYREVAELPGALPELVTRAVTLAPLCERLAELTRPLPRAEEPMAMLPLVDDRRGRLLDILAGLPADEPRRCLVECALERLDVRTREFLWRHRVALPDGTRAVIAFATDLADEHIESRRSLEHSLRLADMYAELARTTLAQTDPAGYDFDAARVRELLDAAARIYGEVAAVDGRPEREEARAALAGIEALAQRAAGVPE